MSEHLQDLRDLGLLQPVGAVLVIDAKSDVLVGISANIAAFAPKLTVDSTLGKMAETVLDAQLLHHARNAAVLPEFARKPEPLGVFDLGKDRLDVVAHQSGDHVIIELVPSKSEVSALSLLKDVTRLAERMDGHRSVEEMSASFLKLLRILSGYDRAQVLKLDTPGTLEVIAEARRTSLEPALGQSVSLCKMSGDDHYGAIKIIVDVDEPAVPVRGHREAQIDLGRCHFTRPTDAKRKQLAGVEMKAEFAQSLVIDGQLWGQIVLQHGRARNPSIRVKYACHMVRPLLETNIARLLS